ncbi:helix-turn-helix domain-containing protein [Halapricum hydrolyticum]|uniref:Helix-turn-helix domain-containing protein n=1 Tax=Halapricum hydrolyticum TaxID=2979991 RepID=A0AAE3IC23_9EURY|nr:helix-turn-helix domain-containing protein [Halapricum hydrolyticum]MCU4718120.1 helix-turn-helix domain-containing protein [Halapricum hydrolyticum]MCU4727372.1 helix-turn-helix domain-containing protein [Halapricum hydrolyticum]
MSDRSTTQSDDESAEVQYDPNSGRYDIYECTVSDCDNVVLVVGNDDPPMSCHDEPMERVTELDMSVKPPDVRQVLLQAFGLPKAGLDICLCVIGEGPLSANEVAEQLGYDRSTVTRYLNKLVELGLLRRSELNREGGGVVKVYHSVDLERMRRETLIGFYVWAGEAASLIEDANLTKQDYLEANPDQELPDVFWENFNEK